MNAEAIKSYLTNHKQKMRKKLLLLTLLIISALPIYAEKVIKSLGWSVYELDTKTKTACLIGCKGDETNIHKEVMHSENGVTEMYPVTAIGPKVLEEDGGAIHEFVVPTHIKDIDAEAFCNATTLSKVIIEDGESINWSGNSIYAFANSPIKEFYLGRQIVGGVRFKSETLEKVTISNNVNMLYYGIFHDCPALKTVFIADGDQPIDYNMPYNDGQSGTFPNMLFGDNSNIETLYIGRDYDLIEERLSSALPFKNLSKLHNLTFGNNVTDLGRYMFNGCNALREVVIPGSVTFMWGEVFSAPLEKLVIMDGSEGRMGFHPGYFNFSDLSHLEYFYMGKFLDEIFQRNIAGKTTVIGKGHSEKVYLRSDRLENLIVYGNHVINVQNSPNLKTVNLEEGMAQLGWYSFEGTNNIEKITFPQSMKIIENAFNNFEKLTEVRIPSSVEECTSFFGKALKKLIYEDGEKPLNLLPTTNSPSPSPIDSLYIGRNMYGSQTGDRLCPLPSNIKIIEFGPFAQRIPDFYFKEYDFTLNPNLQIKFASGIREIGGWAFYESKANELHISCADDLSVETSAFDGSKISKICLDGAKNVSAGYISFRGSECTELVTNEGGISAVGRSAFAESKISQISFAPIVSHIGEYAFAQCPNLKKVAIKCGPDTLNYCSFNNFSSKNQTILDTLSIESGTKYIGDARINTQFLNLGELIENISLSKSAFTQIGTACVSNTKIWAQVSYFMTNNQNSQIDGKPVAEYFTGDVTLPEGIEKIAGAMFQNCVNLNSVRFPESLVSVNSGTRKYAFDGCRNLKAIYLNKSLQSFYGGRYHSYPTEILDAPDIEKYMEIERDIPIATDSRKLYSNGKPVETYKVPESRTVIPENAFLGVRLKGVELHQGITEIGNGAFGWSEIDFQALPHGLKKCGPDSFGYPVIFPRSLEALTMEYYDVGLKTFYFLSPVPPRLILNGTDVSDNFKYVYFQSSTFYVPKGSREAYIKRFNLPENTNRVIEDMPDEPAVAEGESSNILEWDVYSDNNVDFSPESYCLKVYSSSEPDENAVISETYYDSQASPIKSQTKAMRREGTRSGHLSIELPKFENASDSCLYVLEGFDNKGMKIMHTQATYLPKVATGIEDVMESDEEIVMNNNSIWARGKEFEVYSLQGLLLYSGTDRYDGETGETVIIRIGGYCRKIRF